MTDEKKPNLWKRLTNRRDEAGEMPDEPGTQAEGPGEPDEDSAGGWRRWFRGQELARQLEQYSGELAQVRSRIEESFNQLSEYLRSHRPISERIADSLRPMPDLIGQQLRMMEQISGKLDRMGQANEKLSSTLDALPKSYREQSEKLEMIEDQMQSHAQADRAMLENLEQLGHNLASLVRVGETQQKALEDLKEGITGVYDLNNRFLGMAERAMGMMKVMFITGIVGAVLAGILLVAILIRLS